MEPEVLKEKIAAAEAELAEISAFITAVDRELAKKRDRQRGLTRQLQALKDLLAELPESAEKLPTSFLDEILAAKGASDVQR
jgi:chromosome segregation ATPase